MQTQKAYQHEQAFKLHKKLIKEHKIYSEQWGCSV